MKRLAVVCLMLGILLLPGSVAIADDYDIVPVLKGDVVPFDGNLVKDKFIEATRECQIQVDLLEEEVKKAPTRESEGFLTGVGVGAGGVLLLLLLL